MRASKWLTYENGLLLLLGFTFGIVFFDRNAVTFLTPFFIEELNLNNTQIGILGSGLALAWALSAYFISAWSDRSGVRKPFLVITVIVFAVCSFMSGIAGSFMMLLMARIIMGTAEGPVLPICLSIMNAESTPKRRGLNAGLMQTFFAALLGSTLAPIILVFLAESYGWRITFFLAGIPGLICALLIWRYVREPKTDAIQSTAQQTGQSHTMGIIQMLRVHNIRVCSLISCCMVAWLLLGWTFLPIFFTNYRDFSPTQMGYLMSVLGICTMVSGFLVPALSDRVGRKPVMIIFCLMSLLAPLTALYFNGPLWVMGLLLFIGWSGSGVFPLFMGVVPSETVSYKFAATAMGLVVCIGEIIGGVITLPAAGWVADRTSLESPILIMAGCALAGGLISLFLTETAPAKTGALATQPT